MPVDSAGNRADIVMDGYATVNRMNLGRAYELYFNAASRDVTKFICNELNIADKKHAKVHVERIFYEDKLLFDKVYRYLLGYYQIVSLRMFKWFTENITDEQKIDHIASIVKDGVYLYMPPDNEIECVEAVQELEKFYKPTYGPVTYVGNSGNRVITKDPVRIGSVYIMMLEKTGDDWSAVASGKLQHFGILSQLTRSDKYSQPTRTSPIRAIGESEGRIFASYSGQKVIAELMDRNNNPAAHKAIVKSILTADKPSNIPHVIDRDKIHYGGSKPLSIVKHVLQCSGIKFVYHRNDQ